MSVPTFFRLGRFNDLTKRIYLFTLDHISAFKSIYGIINVWLIQMSKKFVFFVIHSGCFISCSTFNSNIKQDTLGVALRSLIFTSVTRKVTAVKKKPRLIRLEGT